MFVCSVLLHLAPHSASICASLCARMDANTLSQAAYYCAGPCRLRGDIFRGLLAPVRGILLYLQVSVNITM
jgi:hypothetical protein